KRVPAGRHGADRRTGRSVARRRRPRNCHPRGDRGMSAPFLDRVVLVTGAGQPLADAVARLFTARGARVALVFLADDAEAAAALAAELPAISCQACDPADPKSVKSAVRQVVERAGRLDVVVNAVTCRADGPISDLDDAVWKRVLDVELGGTVYFC